ncbi:hypothetical protein BASA81_002313 [Batrachochytrium salamandrivorans]|nr:hypothetical protein BASA81_002313 [Batrachochytrium salamandrivorans]
MRLLLVLLLGWACAGLAAVVEQLSREESLTTLGKAKQQKKIAVTACQAVTGTGPNQCRSKIKRCLKDHKIRLKWSSIKCPNTKPGTNQFGCMCENSCPFTCEAGCKANSKQCMWDHGVCKNKKTGLTGHASLCTGVVCRNLGFFCDKSTIQSNCCNGLQCQEFDGIYNCCTAELGNTCANNFDCCSPNLCVDGECAAPL